MLAHGEMYKDPWEINLFFFPGNAGEKVAQVCSFHEAIRYLSSHQYWRTFERKK